MPKVSDSPDSPGTHSEVLMPFVVVASKGGPFDDESFAAGYQAGAIDMRLVVASAVGANVVCVAPESLVAQLDLIAMRHSYTLHTWPSEHGEGCVSCQFIINDPTTPLESGV